MSSEDFGIEYLKSSLSVNTHVGCTLGCAYCTVDEFAEPGITQIYKPAEAVKNLLSNRLFIEGKTPITINNRSDPLLKPVRDSTFAMLQELAEKGIENPKILITKLSLKSEELEILENLPGQAYVIVTYSNLPRQIEHCSHIHQLRSLETLQERERVKAIHYWRPLIKGLNDSSQSLDEVMSNVVSSCDGSILSGLRLNPHIAEKMRSLGAIIDQWTGDTKHKYLPKEVIDKVVALRDQVSPDYPLFRHTSCGITTLIGESDYNFHFLKQGHCLSGCPSVDRCKIGKQPLDDQVSSLMSRLGLSNDWEILDSKVSIKGEINEEERACLAHSLDFPVDAESLSRSPSEGVIRK